MLPTAADIGSACICLGVRKAARMVARRYDEAFRPLGLTSGQFSILAALLRDRAVALSALADDLGMDRTTLNRNLKPLLTQDLIAAEDDEADRRVRGLVLTAAGRERLDRALPIWRRVQAASEARLPEGGWSGLRFCLQGLG